MEDFKPWGMELKVYLMLMHLSQLAGFIIPFGGLVVPIIMWATNKEHSRDIDNHGKVIFNWMLSALIYFFICFILTFIVIGVLGYFALLICGLIFIVMGAIKANGGILWPYPLSIKFFKIEA
ncbi:conserved hypothetical protein [Glaciecola punicea ACAM 611]|jgi:hypothetical protein|uniref:Orotate phosphoribosyltransferase n=1 Tax=Glaciecola punicea ACAM 611 TaxID=1121923 RepID=H5TCW7_9ALTE|nr:DUF4870 domain-containing protein [Glaciecola punicea]OFA30386.1 hypothetical protein BAE46_11610 [Glaciecola punicea]GAB56144.1 conserved hypothetical protein [Glaciecola punicea ACAM 611]